MQTPDVIVCVSDARPYFRLCEVTHLRKDEAVEHGQKLGDPLVWSLCTEQLGPALGAACPRLRGPAGSA